MNVRCLSSVWVRSVRLHMPGCVCSGRASPAEVAVPGDVGASERAMAGGGEVAGAVAAEGGLAPQPLVTPHGFT